MEPIGTKWSCSECAASGGVSVTSYQTGYGLTRTIPHTPSGGLDPHITITCPACSGIGCVVGHDNVQDWTISKKWLEARLSEYKEIEDDRS